MQDFNLEEITADTDAEHLSAFKTFRQSELKQQSSAVAEVQMKQDHGRSVTV